MRKSCTTRSVFRQIVGQILNFAVNATHAGGILRFEAACLPSRWKCEILGIGPGLPDESIERAFAPLHQIARERSEEGADHSGLAICRDLIESLGGDFEIRTIPDQDRRITISFPSSPATY